jgi:predicted helicase
MQNLFKDNIALNSAKYGRQLGSYNYFVTRNITSKDLTSTYDSVNTFPLYIYESDSQRKVNFSSSFTKKMAKFSINLTDEDMLGYIYAILYSPAYRNKYSEFLKINFPKIPFTKDKEIFRHLAELGTQLIHIHLLDAEAISLLKDKYPIGDFLGDGGHIVENHAFVLENGIGKLYINKAEYFDHVPQQVYDFCIGGYQVLDKYMYYREQHDIVHELDHIENTIRAIAFTIDQMNEINKYTKSWI